MSHDMLHHAKFKIFFEVLHKFEFIWIWNLVWIWIWKPYRKRNRKWIRKSREKEKAISAQTSPPGPVPRAPVAPDRRTPPVGVSLPRECSLYLSLALCPLGPICRRQLSFARALSFSLCLAGPDCQSSSHCPHALVLSPCAMGQPCQFCLPHARRGPARAHSRTSPDFSAITPAHVPSSLYRALPVPRAHPSPHFAQLHPLSRSAHVVSRRRRPAPASPTIQRARDRPKPPRAMPRGETPLPMPNFPYCALCSANFAFAGARPRRSAVLVRWPADLAWSSSSE
jgi:hypothetical protein